MPEGNEEGDIRLSGEGAFQIEAEDTAGRGRDDVAWGGERGGWRALRNKDQITHLREGGQQMMHYPAGTF